MKTKRAKELNFLIKTKTPVCLIETRSLSLIDTGIYEDHYTVPELIDFGLVEYIGKIKNKIYIRPLRSFCVYVLGEKKNLYNGDIVVLCLGDVGKKDFDKWTNNEYK